MRERQPSGASSLGGDSLMSEEPLPEEDEEPLGLGIALEETTDPLAEETEPAPPPPPPPAKPVEEKPDPFSLRAVESRKLAEATVPKKEHEELLAKLRILEARRAEDRERLREVDRFKEEAEHTNRMKEQTKGVIFCFVVSELPVLTLYHSQDYRTVG